MIPRIFIACLIAAIVTARPQENLDKLIDEVFGGPNTLPTSPPQPQPQPVPKQVDPQPNEGTRGVTRDTPDNEGDCTCVPYYLCPNGTILTDGTGLLDIRAKAGACADYMDVCCNEPLDESQPLKPPPTKRRGCGQRHPEGVGFRITGGKDNEAQFGEFPWMVALLKRTLLSDGSDLMVYACGGALIHEKVVLTAAHCVMPSNDDTDLLARVGEWDTQTNNEIYRHQNVKVSKVIIHPGFRRNNLYNDYALLILEKPVELGENVDTVCLPTTGYVPLSSECYATGWGKDKFGDKGQYQVILKKIDLPIVPKDQCLNLLRKTRLGPFFKLHDSFVCAGGIVGKDTCKGDGGSPLVCPMEGKQGTYEVTGLVAWGIGCGDETPGVYAGVAYARQWIDQELQKLGLQLESQ